MAKSASRQEPDKSARAEISYDAAVKEAKEIIAKGEESQWRLAELAHRVETQHGKRKLQEFASAIGACPNTLKRHRSVFRAWKGGPAPSFLSFAIAQALANHPDRFELIKKNPDITRAAARKLMVALRENGGQQTADARVSDKAGTVSKRQGELLIAANKATSAAREIRQWLADGREVTTAMEEAFREFVEEATGMLEAWKVRRGLPQGEQPDAPSSEVPALPVKPESVH